MVTEISAVPAYNPKKTEDEEGAETEEPALVGLRDRALIGAMVYTFARINAVLQMKVRDYFVQGRRGWVRLHEKGGKASARSKIDPSLFAKTDPGRL